jgi:hypothetical protein
MEQMVAISNHNKRTYSREEMLHKLPHLETWLRSTGWTYLHFALCRKLGKALFLQLPASCIESINAMRIGERITYAMVKERLEPHLVAGTRLLDCSDPFCATAVEWAGKALLIKCSVVLNPIQHENDVVDLAEMDIRIFPVCTACSKEMPKRAVCSGCTVTCYCSPECQRTHWKESHKKECAMMKESLRELEEYYRRVTPPYGQRTLSK